MTDDERAALNAAVAERVLGWTARTEPDMMAPKGSAATRTVWTRPDGTRTRRLPDFAGDWAAAGQVLDWLAAQDDTVVYVTLYSPGRCCVNIRPIERPGDHYPGVYGHGETVSEAATRAALAWAARHAAGANAP